MESTYAGLIQLPRGIVCKNEVLSKTFRTSFGGLVAGIQMPMIVEGTENKHGLLKSSTPGLEYDIDWGFGIRFPDKTSFVKAATIIFKGTEEDADSVYRAFPGWLSRLEAMIKMYSYDLFREPITQKLQMGADGKPDKYTGLSLNRISEGKWEDVYNPDRTITVKFDPNYDNDGFSSKELSEIIRNAGESAPFSQSHYFLSEACRAYQRGDNRGCVVFSGLALEYSIIARVKKYCKDCNMSFSPLGMLGKKFKKLKELKIEIPISDYQHRIVDFRNDVVHKGISVTDLEAVQFWKDCSLLVHSFDDNMYFLEDYTDD